MGRGRLWLGVLVVLGLLLFGFVFLKLPTPAIVVAAERILSLGPVDITNTIITSWLVVLSLITISWLATRRMSLVPSGLQNFVEAVLEWFLGLAQSIAGVRNGRRFFIPCCTIFLFVVTSNWMSLLPVYNQIGKPETLEEQVHHIVEGADEDEPLKGKKFNAVVLGGSESFRYVPIGPEEITIEVPDDLTPHEFEERVEQEVHAQLEKEGLPKDAELGLIVPVLRNANTDLNMTLALAIMSAIFVESWGFSTLGTRYLGKFFAFASLRRGVMGGVDVFVGILEFIAESARLISFTFRLFGNMFAGEVLLFVMAFIVPLVITVPFYGLELFVGLIQALVFSLLTLVFGVIAVSTHGGEGDHAEEGGHPIPREE